ncbi:XRE family transcriptional regulator [Spirillospora sp. NBC_01491]|uniref:XRE family transcriptional regulator n=1 Tax=Spirillospora sp. NBC_01491 TaxID=2976007 RepID=UPI002E325BA3|nr:XRE family transcriptional regulator [Spirillospora sp. NBC_01491]
MHTVIPELRRILAYVDVGPDLDGPPRSLDVLAAEVATARRLETQAQLGKLASRIPGVLEELTWWAYDSDSATAWRLLALAHRSAVGLTRRLGYSGDSLALLERAADAARRSGDPHLPHLMTLSRALLLMAMAQYAPAGTLLDRAAADVDGSRKDAHEVSGALALRSAIVASRAGDTERAWDRYGRATDQIRSGTGTPVYGLEFTPGNVSIHGAAVAAELGELDEAARRDHAITDRTLAALPPERRAHHEIDMSRVHLETGDYETALARLDSADRIAGQMVTFHPTARTTVAHLVDIRRTLPEPLRRLHSRMAV